MISAQRDGSPIISSKHVLIIRNLGRVGPTPFFDVGLLNSARYSEEIQMELNVRSDLSFFGEVVHSFAVAIAKNRYISASSIEELVLDRLRVGDELCDVWDALAEAYCHYVGR